MSFDSDSTKHAENFGEFLIKILKFPVGDTMLSRIAYPFIYTEIIAPGDWGESKFENLTDLQSKKTDDKLRKIIRNELRPQPRFRNIFAIDSVKGQNLSLTYFKNGKKGFYFHFIAVNGKWYLNSVQELPLIDGGLPITQ